MRVGQVEGGALTWLADATLEGVENGTAKHWVDLGARLAPGEQDDVLLVVEATPSSSSSAMPVFLDALELR